MSEPERAPLSGLRSRFLATREDRGSERAEASGEYR
jgi:hypothetical protein